ncbi:MAG TPA: hypothetical protein VFS30_14765 [Dehalococcoidia bacterium]|nr:hypothetical protein [Dehalococcoidia bacterium]
MFDASFYAETLPNLVQTECRRQPDKTPVVELRLGDGTTLDVCHVTQLAERWLGVTFFRDAEKCDDMDVSLLPYELVTRITVSLHHQQTRKLGFSIEDTVKSAAAVDATAETRR